jgi:anti-anti-sigma regulatory factor
LRQTAMDRPPASDQRLEVSAQSDWACAWLHVEGALVASTVPRLRRAIETVSLERPRKVHLLMSGVAMVDEAGAEFLAEASRRAQSSGTKLVIRSLARGEPGGPGRHSFAPRGQPRLFSLFSRRPGVVGRQLSPRIVWWRGRATTPTVPASTGPPFQSA